MRSNNIQVNLSAKQMYITCASCANCANLAQYFDAELELSSLQWMYRKS